MYKSWRVWDVWVEKTLKVVLNKAESVLKESGRVSGKLGEALKRLDVSQIWLYECEKIANRSRSVLNRYETVFKAPSWAAKKS